MCVCVCVHARMRACVRVGTCVCVRECECLRARACVYICMALTACVHGERQCSSAIVHVAVTILFEQYFK